MLDCMKQGREKGLAPMYMYMCQKDEHLWFYMYMHMYICLFFSTILVEIIFGGLLEKPVIG